MPELRRRFRHPENLLQSDGLYVHSSPPRVLPVKSAYVKQLIRNGDLDKLQNLVIEGQGKRLIGTYSPDYKTRTFLKSIPILMTKLNLLHDAVNSGRLHELKALLDDDPDKKKLVLAKDEAGVGLLHKAVYYNLKDIAKWLIETNPQTATMKDSEGRTPYHYTPLCKDPVELQKLLMGAGADPSCLDSKQRSAKYYTDHPSELELPSLHKSALKSPRKSHPEGMVFKKSNIRIWIHQRDLHHLQQVVWEGHGSKLLVEHSNNQKVKRFLEAVPHIMGLIRDVHVDVQNDDLDSLKTHTSSPISARVFSGKDGNGLTPLHKAAGLGRQDIAEYIVDKYPEAVSLVDNEGRTPLHYAALAKDDGKLFNFLLGAGADESVLDNKQKTAAYYKARGSEIDQKLLSAVPECPRSAKENFAATWDWNQLTSSPSTEGIAKTLKKLVHDDDSEEKHVAEEAEKEKQEKPVQNGKAEDDKPKEDAPKEEVKEEAKEEPPAEKVEEAKAEEAKEPEPPKEEEKKEEEEKEEAPKEEAKPEETKEEEIKEEEKKETTPSPKPKESSPKPEESSPKPDESSPKPETNSPKPGEGSPKPEESSPKPETSSPQPGNSPKPDAKPEEKGSPSPEGKKESPSPNGKNGSPSPEGSKGSPSPEGKKESPSPNGKKESPSPDGKKASPKPEKSVDSADEGVIEGVVNGENEIESVNEQGQGVDEKGDDQEVAALIEEGNMEQLAALVLNGDGERLVGHHSENPELQAFLENVPIYMSKINRIHVAARDGSLRDLQAALDRRKFAIAKDHISPNEASPLHVATIFGNTSIVRYLAGRFPETVQTADSNGRTPLHYAAVLADNGHYYNLLVHLGADVRAEDKFEHTPDHYRSNQEEFSHRSLLADFGAEESADELLQDKVPDDTCSARKDLDDPDMIAVLERCYNLLHGRRNSNAISAASHTTTMSESSTTSVSSKHMKRYIFDAVKLRLTRLDHNFYDLIWPSVKKLPQEKAFRVAVEQDFPLGIVAPDFYAYKVFQEYLEPIVKDSNSIDLHTELRNQPETKFSTGEADEDLEFDLDPFGKNIITGTLECTRNLADFELPMSLNAHQLEEVERILTSALLSPSTAKALYPHATENEINERGSGNYYTMNEVLEDPSEVRVVLAANGLLIPLWNIPNSDRLHGKHWPYGRGVFVSSSGNLAAWINVLDHLRIVTCTSSSKPADVGQIYSRIHRLLGSLDLSFRRDERLGYLSARPTCLGNTLHFNLTVRFPHLVKEQDNLRHLCVTRGLTFQKCDSSSDAVKISNQQSLGVTELQTFEDFTTAVNNILQLEKDLAMSNSLHIAALFVNIFRRKRAGLTDSS